MKEEIKDLNEWIFLCLYEGGFNKAFSAGHGLGFGHNETNDFVPLTEIMEYSNQGITVTSPINSPYLSQIILTSDSVP
jgi:hypothetical protein